ncbi:MAG: TRAP transporter small permease [Bacteroidota bacterium]|nr:TRAP transporter small permease [Bacteroidota bacterium]
MNLTDFRFKIDRMLERTLIALMGIMVINVLWQVFTRFILKDPSSYTEELARYLLVWLGLLGASYAVGKKLHLAIDILTSKLIARRKQVSDIFINCCVFVFSFGVIFIGGMNLVSLTLDLQQTSAALQIKLGYVYSVVPLSGLLMMFYAGSSIIESIKNFKEVA